MDSPGGMGVAAFVIPISVLLIAIVGVVITRFLIKQYQRVPPNKVAVVFGKKHGEKGYRVITGGGFFLWPVVEEVGYLSLNVMSIEVAVQKAPDQNGVLLDVKGVANVKLRSAAEQLPAAIERFLGKSEEEIKRIAKDNLEGNLRALTGTLTVEELIRDRAKFQGMVLSQVGTDMAKLGLEIDLLNIQDIRDGTNYIDSLGRKQTAGIVRDAEIGEAEAKRETAIKTAAAQREGQVAQAQAAQEISNAERERDEIKAQNTAKVQAAEARIQIVADIAAADEQKKLNVTVVAAEQAKVEAETKLQDAVRQRTEATLNATTIVQAEKAKEAKIIGANADKEARIITAEGAQQAATREGEALRVKAEKEGQGDQAKMTAQAAGRIEQAKAVQAEAEAKAAGEKAQLLAQAEGHKAQLLADAEGVKAKLLAEAQGIEKKAEAFAKLDQAGRFLMLMEALPPILEAFGKYVVAPAAESIGEGLANVDEIRIIDMGAGGTNGKGNILSQFAGMPVETLFGIFQKIQASGMGPALEGLLSKAGIDLNSLMMGMTGGPSKSTGLDPAGEVVPPSAPDGRGKK